MIIISVLWYLGSYSMTQRDRALAPPPPPPPGRINDEGDPTRLKICVEKIKDVTDKNRLNPYRVIFKVCNVRSPAQGRLIDDRKSLTDHIVRSNQFSSFTIITHVHTHVPFCSVILYNKSVSAFQTSQHLSEIRVILWHRVTLLLLVSFKCSKRNTTWTCTKEVYINYVFVSLYILMDNKHQDTFSDSNWWRLPCSGQVFKY